MALIMEKPPAGEEEEEDVEALRLAALRTLHTRKLAPVAQPPVPVVVPHAVAFTMPDVFRVPPPPPVRRGGMPQRGHIIHPKRNMNGILPKMNAGFWRHRTNSNLISIVPISDEPVPQIPQSSEVPKLVLPQDRYCKTPDIETKSKTTVPTKFSRYEDSDSDSSAESDDDSSSNRSRKRRRKELESREGNNKMYLDEKNVFSADEGQTCNIKLSPTADVSESDVFDKPVENVTPLNSGRAIVSVASEGQAVDEHEVSLETLMQQLNEAIGDGPTSEKMDNRQNPRVASNTVILPPPPLVVSPSPLVVPPSPLVVPPPPLVVPPPPLSMPPPPLVVSPTPLVVPFSSPLVPLSSPFTVAPPAIVKSNPVFAKCQAPTSSSMGLELENTIRIPPVSKQVVTSELVPQMVNFCGVNVSVAKNDTLPIESTSQYISNSKIYQNISPSRMPQFSSGRPKSPQYSRPWSPNRETSMMSAKQHSLSPLRELLPLPGARYSESKVRRAGSPNFREVSPKRSLSPIVRRRSPSAQQFRSPTPELKRTISPRRSLSPRPVKSPHRYSPRRQGSLSPRRYASPSRRLSRSPCKQHIVSPPRHCSRSPRRHHSPSPIRRQRSSSPNRRRTPSPHRRRQVSPQSPRRQMSPLRRQYSPIHGQHSPLPRQQAVLRRQRSPSPRNNSLSPYRRQSSSPHRQRFLSPRRQCSPSPVRSFSPSSRKKRSVSPLHRLPRSPRRFNSRSPTPLRLNSRSPTPRRHNSRSPTPRRRNSRSPTPRRRNSRSPTPRRRNSRSPTPRRHNSRSPTTRRHNSRSPTPRRLSSHSPLLRRIQSRSPPLHRLNSRSPPLHRLKSRSPPLHRLNSRSPPPRLNSHSPTHRQHSPFSTHAVVSPSRRHITSPPRLLSLQRRPSLHSPSRQRSPSPLRERSRSHSPCRDCTRSPCRKHSPLPRKRSTSPCRLRSPLPRKQQSPVSRRKQSSPFRKLLKSPQRAQSPLMSKNREFNLHHQASPSRTLVSSSSNKQSPLLQRRNPSPPPPRMASPVFRVKAANRWSSMSPSSSPSKQKSACEGRSPVGSKNLSPKRRVSPLISNVVNKMSPVRERVPEMSKSPFSQKCSTSPNMRTRNESPRTKRRKHSRSPTKDSRKSKGTIRYKDGSDRQFKAQKPKSVERECNSRRHSSSDSKSSNHSSSLSLSPSPDRNDVPTSPIRVTNIKYQSANHRPPLNKGLERNLVGTLRESDKKPHRRERENFDLSKKRTKRSASRSPSSKTSDTNFDDKSHQKHLSGFRKHRAPSTKLKVEVEVDPVVEARKRKFESSCAIDPNKKKIRLRNKTEVKENIQESVKEDTKKIDVLSPKQNAKCASDPSLSSQETVNTVKKLEKSDWDDIEEMEDTIQELEKAVNLWSSDESDFECHSAYVPKGIGKISSDVDVGNKGTDEVSRERSESRSQDKERSEKRDKSKPKKDEPRGNRWDRKEEKHSSWSGGDVDTQLSPAVEDRKVGSEQDLRMELSRRRAERLTKAGSVHESLPARLVQSAFQSVVGIKALRKLEQEDEERRRKREAIKAERSKKPRRVTLLKKADVEDELSYFNITFPKGSKHMERLPSPLPVKVPVQMRLGIPAGSGKSRRRRDKASSTSRKRNRRKGKRNAMPSGMEQV